MSPTRTPHRLFATALRGALCLLFALTPVSSAQGPWIGLAAADTYSTGGRPGDVLTADLDGDGILDLVVTIQLNDAIAVLLGNGSGGVGDGTFQAPFEVLTGPNPYTLTAGDFNEDGDLDLASTHGGGGVFVLLGDGDGTFATAQRYNTSAIQTALATADLNSDGILDLVTAAPLADRVGVLLGQGTGGVGDGTFGAETTFATAPAPGDVVALDLDGDGITDLVTANRTDQNVSVLLGNGSGGMGDGTFQAPLNFPSGTEGNHLAAADFNEDGVPDLAVSNRLDHTLHILLAGNSGGVWDGTFAAPLTSPATLAPLGLQAADLDGDGHPDLAAANASNGLLSIHLGLGDGTFAPTRSYSVDRLDHTSAPSAVALGDFNGDGHSDLATANVSNDNVGILLNAGPAPAEGALLLTELMADPAQVSDAQGEYLEIYNNTAFPLHLQNWKVENSSGSRGFLRGTIDPGAFFVVGSSADLDGGGFAPDVEPNTFPSLNQAGDVVTLRDTADNLYAQVSFASGNAFGPGVSYELANVHAAVAGVAAETAYRASTTPFGADLGSPGSAGTTSTALTATVTPIAGPGGNLDPANPQAVAISGTASFTVTPAKGYSLAGVGGTCPGLLEGSVFTTDPVLEDCTVEATFIQNSTSLLLASASLVRVGEAVTFTVEVSGIAGAPVDGSVEVSASTGETCADGIPTVGSSAVFACDLTFATLGPRTVSATFSGSATHTASSTPSLGVEVKRFADVSVTADDGQTLYVDGEPLVYLLQVRNAGPDFAPGTHVVTATLPELEDVEWECIAVGGAVCPATGGVGEVDLFVDLPTGGGLDLTYGGVVPLGWLDPVAAGVEAIVSEDAPDEVYDPQAANNFATDVNSNELIFEDGFDSGDTTAWSQTVGGEAPAGGAPVPQ